jgi:hypothetical protein
MCLMSAVAADRVDRIRIGAALARVFILTVIVAAGIAVYSGFSPLEAINTSTGSFVFYVDAAISLLSLIIVWCLLPVSKSGGKKYSLAMLTASSIISAAGGAWYVLVKTSLNLPAFYIDKFIPDNVMLLAAPAAAIIAWAVYFAVSRFRKSRSLRAADANYGAMPFVESETAERDDELDKFISEIEE